MSDLFQKLAKELDGNLRTDDLHRRIYATDASIYRELPEAVAYPRHTKDVQILVRFAAEHGIPILARGAGTSLAGQCVGNGIIIDCSRHMDQVLEFNSEEQWVRVQPGLVRDHLNEFLKPHGLQFGVNTSTSNRATLGGMAGNNSCGSTSIVYGTTRDHVLEMEVVLNDGSLATIGPQFHPDSQSFQENTTIAKIEKGMSDLLSADDLPERIRAAYPHPDLHRRNTGYALDALLESKPFNLCKLLCGSEGTLAFTTSLKIKLQKLPPPEVLLVCVHFSSLRESLEAVPLCLKHSLYACELMDKTILDCTRENRQQRENRFFLEGDPAAVLILELRADQPADLHQQAAALIADLKSADMGYAYPQVIAKQVSKVWELRKAGLGVLADLPNTGKAIACVEDTAVRPEDLPDYIREFSEIMAAHDQEAVYYAHAGAGELHLRPILDLREEQQRSQLQTIMTQTARLVRKYHGALSGEHGDGRVRAPFLPEVFDDWLIELFRKIKLLWDPDLIFNPGKIVDPKPLLADLRARPDIRHSDLKTMYRFPQGVFHAADRCTGSGDCRKKEGLMCPSYQATQQESDSTRARANALREYLQEPGPKPFDHPELAEVLDLCLSCKGCTRECPSSVNMTLLKSEFLYQYYRANRRPVRDWFFGYYDRLMKLAAIFPELSNSLLNSRLLSGLPKRWLGITSARSLPNLDRQTLYGWYKKQQFPTTGKKGRVYLMADEFLNYSETQIGQKAVLLLQQLGYKVHMLPPLASGRTYYSKGFLKRGRKLACRQVARYRNLIGADCPLIGLEPSALLSFREEYPALLAGEEQKAAEQLSEHCLLLDEFLIREVEAGHINSTQFTDSPARVLLHVHCHQRSIGNTPAAALALSLASGYQVELLQNSCCGMAGSFGYEAEHLSLSQTIGQKSLAAIAEADKEVLIAASGVSCRQQIQDVTGRKAFHPAELLFEVLRFKSHLPPSTS